MASITPQRFITLKNRITSECARRSKIGDAPGSVSLTQYAAAAYNFSVAPAVNTRIRKEHLNKSWDVLRKVNSDRIGENTDKLVVSSSLSTLEEFVTVLESNPEPAVVEKQSGTNSNYSDCSGGCTGLCFGCTSCTNACKNECTSCTGCTGCTGSCTGSCTGTCSGSCTGGCQGSCSGTCKTGCKDGCVGGCLGCSGGCRGYCIGTASKGYSSCGGCDNGCYGGCCSDCSSNCGSHINIPTTGWQAHNNQISGCIRPGWRPDWWNGRYT